MVLYNYIFVGLLLLVAIVFAITPCPVMIQGILAAEGDAGPRGMLTSAA